MVHVHHAFQVHVVGGGAFLATTDRNAASIAGEQTDARTPARLLLHYGRGTSLRIPVPGIEQLHPERPGHIEERILTEFVQVGGRRVRRLEIGRLGLPGPFGCLLGGDRQYEDPGKCHLAKGECEPQHGLGHTGLDEGRRCLTLHRWDSLWQVHGPERSARKLSGTHRARTRDV